MTGYASASGAGQGFEWTWEMRGVNAKGLDIRIRVPDWIEGLEAGIRAVLTKSLSRGSVSVGLRIQAVDEGSAFSLNEAHLTDVLTALEMIEEQAMARGISLAPSKASDIIGLRGVFEASSQEKDVKQLTQDLLKSLPALVDDFKLMRQTEGASLSDILENQISEISELTEKSAMVAEARKDEMKDTLKANLARVLDNADGVDEARLAQELATLVVKSDVTEEIDRLKAHVDAARGLIAKGSPIGRKLDFLMQEFNREANTLCSKAQNVDLTTLGLDLKTVIDQMREQVQNVE
ncbi:YicC/YloC family endoribonuclease [Cognatishimia sp.]